MNQREKAEAFDQLRKLTEEDKRVVGDFAAFLRLPEARIMTIRKFKDRIADLEAQLAGERDRAERWKSIAQGFELAAKVRNKHFKAREEAGG